MTAPPPVAPGTVLYIFQMPEYSGAETAQLSVLRADPHALVACPPASPVEALVRCTGADTVALPFRSLRHSGGLLEMLRSLGRGLRSARDLRRVLRSHPERRVLYCTSLRPALIAGLAALGLRRRAIWVVPDFLPPAPLRWLVRGLARLSCAAALPLSRAIADDFCGRSRRLRDRTTVVHPGLDLGSFDPSGAARPPPRAAIIGHVCGLKRTDLAVDIAGLVAQECPGFELDVVGRAQYRDEDFRFEAALQRRVENDAHLRDVVTFRGHVADVATTLDEYAMLLHCRDDEPFGMVLIEAMAAGVPVVAPDRAGPREIVVPDETGFRYPPGDAAAAARAVVTLLEDPDRALEMGRAGRRRAEELFDARRSVATIRAIIDSVAAL